MVIPRGCTHPDCFNCPLPDCTMDACGVESAQINDIVKKMRKLDEDQQKAYDEELMIEKLDQEYMVTGKRRRGRPRKYAR